MITYLVFISYFKYSGNSARLATARRCRWVSLDTARLLGVKSEAMFDQSSIFMTEGT